MALKTGRGASAPPFLVMDVITAANARQAALPPGAPHVIRMEVGQPGTGAPQGALPTRRSSDLKPSVWPRCARASPPMAMTGTAWRWRRRGWR